MKTNLKIAAIVILILTCIAGCVRIDYAVFKSKYPNAGFGSYLWSSK